MVRIPINEDCWLGINGVPRAYSGAAYRAAIVAFVAERRATAEELGVSPSKVEAITLGSHGESMVPLSRQATVGGKPLAGLVDEDTLFVTHASVDGGPMLKRFMPAAMGRATPIRKRTSHVTIVVGTKE